MHKIKENKMQNIIIENSILYESNAKLDEKTKNWYVEGIFSKPDEINGNRRIYPSAILESAINEYKSDYIDTKRSLGELNHPSDGSLSIDLTKASHLIEYINQNSDGSYYGRAKLLRTPMGNIAAGILESGAILGISTRGAGQVRKNAKSIDEVQSGYKILTLDLVSSPSCKEALLQGIYESSSFITDNVDEEFVQKIAEELKSISAAQLAESKIKLFNKFIETISLKN